MSGLTLDLFAGAGGASLGLRAIGRPAIGYEIDPTRCATHSAAGHVTVRADLGIIEWPRDVEVDLLHASPPCQPFSKAKLGAGHLDARDGMPHVLRAIDELAPRVATVEQVPGLFNSRHRGYGQRFVAALSALGYEVDHRVLDAADYGVPQHRRRVFIVARRDDVTPKWPDPTHGTEGAPLVSMRQALGALEERQPVALDVGRVGYRTPEVTAGGGLFVIAGRDTRATVRSIDELAPTVVARKDAKGWHLLDADAGRAWLLTLDDVAVLQGFPRSYPFRGPPTEVAQQVGNASPPALIAAVVGANA